MRFGMPQGFADLIRKKYDIMQQAQDTTRLGTEAAANLDRVRAQLMPKESEAENALRLANAGLAGANTRFTDVQASEFGKTAEAQRGLWSTQGRVNLAQIPLLGAQTRLTGQQATGEEQLNEMRDIYNPYSATAGGMMDWVKRRLPGFGF